MELKVTTVGFEDGIDLPDFDKLIDYVSHELCNRIAIRTPVATGRAQAGWHVEGHAIVNEVDYVQFLEYGHSNQAPNGMVRVSLEEAPEIIDDFLDKNYPRK